MLRQKSHGIRVHTARSLQEMLRYPSPPSTLGEKEARLKVDLLIIHRGESLSRHP